MAINQLQDVQALTYTRELLPNIVDHLADVRSHTLYAEYTVSTLTFEQNH